MDTQQITEAIQEIVTNAQTLMGQILPMLVTLLAFLVLVPMAKRLMMAGEPDRRSDVDYDDEWEPDLEAGCPECGGDLIGTNAGGEPMCGDCGLGVYTLEEERQLYGEMVCPDCGGELRDEDGKFNWCRNCDQ